MNKYDPLSGHLRRQKLAEFEMTFVEIERVFGAMLPNSAARPQWWRTSPTPMPRMFSGKLGDLLGTMLS